jgi:hypothetical protein
VGFGAPKNFTDGFIDYDAARRISKFYTSLIYNNGIERGPV